MLPPLSDHPAYTEPPRLNEPVVKYRCQECYSLHDDEADAEECCPPEVDEVFVCPVCEKQSASFTKASECCDPVDPAAAGIPTAAELEAAGQLSMFAGRDA